jgi:ribosome-associated heat shock protein Hsp15
MSEKVRLDKWLWAARFYKTRSLATEAINGGKVHVNGERVKPSRAINTGDEVKVSKGELSVTVEVLALSDKRGPAKVAQTLYQETEASVNKRETLVEQRKLMRASQPLSEQRPNKKQRRQIHRFRNIHDHS